MENTAAVTATTRIIRNGSTVAGPLARVEREVTEIHVNGELAHTIVWGRPLLERLERQGTPRDGYIAYIVGQRAELRYLSAELLTARRHDVPAVRVTDGVAVELNPGDNVRLLCQIGADHVLVYTGLEVLLRVAIDDVAGIDELIAEACEVKACEGHPCEDAADRFPNAGIGDVFYCNGACR